GLQADNHAYRAEAAPRDPDAPRDVRGLVSHARVAADADPRDEEPRRGRPRDAAEGLRPDEGSQPHAHLGMAPDAHREAHGGPAVHRRPAEVAEGPRRRS